MGRLFGADGIRGIVDGYPLRHQDTERIGRAIAALMREYLPFPVFLVGADTRESSQRLKVALVAGLTRGGVRVVDAGIIPTAGLSYLIAERGLFVGGAMVSASHNPIEENGLKFFDERGLKLSDEAEDRIEGLFFGEDALPFESWPSPTIDEPNYITQYARALTNEYRDHEWSDLRVVIDCANGAAFYVAPLVMQRLSIPFYVINADPDGININLRAGSEYVRTNPDRLVWHVRAAGAQVGMALDGDADRLIVVDLQGNVYDGDMLLAMLAIRLHQDQRLAGDSIVATHVSNSGLQHYLSHYQIGTYLVRNGDKYVTRELIKRDLTLGGEQIGHIILHTDEAHVTGDGLRTALFLLGELAKVSSCSIQQLAPRLKKWPQVKASAYLGRRIEIPIQGVVGLEVLADLASREIPDLTRIDCRPASTEPVYRIMLEAQATPVHILANWAFRLARHVQAQLGCSGQPIEVFDCVTGRSVSPLG